MHFLMLCTTMWTIDASQSLSKKQSCLTLRKQRLQDKATDPHLVREDGPADLAIAETHGCSRTDPFVVPPLEERLDKLTLEIPKAKPKQRRRDRPEAGRKRCESEGAKRDEARAKSPSTKKEATHRNKMKEKHWQCF